MAKKATYPRSRRPAWPTTTLRPAASSTYTAMGKNRMLFQSLAGAMMRPTTSAGASTAAARATRRATHLPQRGTPAHHRLVGPMTSGSCRRLMRSRPCPLQRLAQEARRAEHQDADEHDEGDHVLPLR